MPKLYDALVTACDNYQAMQQEHLHCLATEAPPDMARLGFERARLFADLQNHLTAMRYQFQATRAEPVLLARLRARISALLADDALLAERLQAYRGTLAQRCAEVQQGQKALVGYGNLYTPLRPRFVDTAG